MIQIHNIDSDTEFAYGTSWNDTEKGKAIIYLFGRGENREKVIKKLTSYKPYFFIEIDKDLPSEVHKYILKVEKEKIYTTLYNDKCIKVYAKNPKCVPLIRVVLGNYNIKHFESDVLFRLNFTLDCFNQLKDKITFDVDRCRIFIIDIETTTSHSDFPNPSSTPENITSITVHDNYLNQYHTFVWRNDLTEELINDTDLKTILHKFKDERDMLSNFLNFWNSLSPDIVVGHNLENFDIPYIINRVKLLFGDRRERKLSPINKVWIRENPSPSGEVYYQSIIMGVNTFDTLHWYKEITLGEQRSYGLDNIAKDEGLGIKPKVNAEKLWLDDWRKLVEYNVNDVFLTKAIFEKKKMLDFVNGIRKVALVNMSDLYYFSRAIDTLMLKKAKESNIILPSKPDNKNYIKPDKSLYEGAYVFADRGIYKSVGVFDFNSLYPRIIQTFNLSKELIEDNPSAKMGKFEKSINNVVWKSSQIGIMPQIINTLLEMREKFEYSLISAKTKEEAEDADNMIQAVKNLICSVPHDTLVLVKDIHDTQQWVEIKQIDIQKTPYVLSVNKKGVAEWKKIKKVISHLPTTRNMRSIQTQYGYRIRTTSNHSLFRIKNKKIETIQAGQLKKGDEIVCVQPNRISASMPLEEIWITDYLNEDNKRIEVLLKDKHISNHSDCIKRWSHLLLQKEFKYKDNSGFTKFMIGQKFIEKKGWSFKTTLLGEDFQKLLSLLSHKKQKSRSKVFKYYFVLSIKEFNNLPESMKNMFNFKLHCNKCWNWKDFSPKLQIKDSLLKLLGWYISEGSIASHFHGFQISQTNYKECWIDMEEFNKDYKLTYKRREGICQFISPIFSYFLKEICGKYSYGKQLPPFFQQLSLGQQHTLIRTYLLGDGHLWEICTKPYKIKCPYWGAGTVSKKLAMQLLLYFPEAHLNHDKTLNHPYYYIVFKDKFRVKSKLNNSYSLKITKIEDYEIKEDELLYDLSVEDNENFVCGDCGFILAHNTAYGCFANPYFRLFDVRVAATITYLGRELIQEMSKYVKEKYGRKHIYSDTDSIFFELGDIPIDFGFKIQDDLNQHIKDFCKERWNISPEKNLLSLKFEKYYKTLLVDAKKRYAGWLTWKKGKQRDEVTVTGMEYRRTDASIQLHYLQSKILDLILKDKELREIEKEVWSEIDKVKNCKDYEYVAIPTKFGKIKYENDLPRVRGLEYAKQLLNLTILPGQKVLLLYVEMEADALCFERNIDLENKNIKLNTSKMIERNILNPLENILTIKYGEKYFEDLKCRVKNKLQGQKDLGDWR